MKFTMKTLNLKNFNVIPMGLDNDRPPFYSKMIETVNKMKDKNNDFFNKMEKTNSQESYSMFAAQNYVKPKIESA